MTRRRTPPPGVDSWNHVTARLRESAQARRDLPTDRQRVQQIVLELAGRVQGRRVLDIGPDANPLARALAQQGAEVLIARDPLEPVTPLRGPFDVVTAAHCIDDSEDPEATLRAAAKLLHPRGRIVLAIGHPWRRVADGASPHPALATLPSLLATLRAAGLRLVDAVEPESTPATPEEKPEPRYLVLLAERTGRRARNRGTRG
ncbi:MAG: methyltransferase domain-containing protein [Myxococcota bacterium]